MFCQKFKDLPAGLEQLVHDFKTADWNTMEVLQYLCFFALMMFFFIGNRVCPRGAPPKPAMREVDDPTEPDASHLTTYRDVFCANKDQLSLNFGVAFLCMVAGRAYYKRYAKKKDQKIA